MSREAEPRPCEGCGEPLPADARKNKKYHDAACKQKGHRDRNRPPPPERQVEIIDGREWTVTQLPPGKGPKPRAWAYLTEERRWNVFMMARDGHDEETIMARLGLTRTTVRRLLKRPPEQTRPDRRYRRLVRVLRGAIAETTEILRHADAEGRGWRDTLFHDDYDPMEEDWAARGSTVGDIEIWLKDAREVLREAEATRKLLDRGLGDWEASISTLMGQLRKLGWSGEMHIRPGGGVIGGRQKVSRARQLHASKP